MALNEGTVFPKPDGLGIQVELDCKYAGQASQSHNALTLTLRELFLQHWAIHQPLASLLAQPIRATVQPQALQQPQASFTPTTQSQTLDPGNLSTLVLSSVSAILHRACFFTPDSKPTIGWCYSWCVFLLSYWHLMTLIGNQGFRHKNPSTWTQSLH